MSRILTFLIFSFSMPVFAQIDNDQFTIQPYRMGIIVSDIDSATAWYSAVFDVELQQSFLYPEYDSMRVHLLKNNDVQFELVSRKYYYRATEIINGYDLREKPIIGIYKVTYQVNEIEDLYEAIKKKGVEIYFKLGTH